MITSIVVTGTHKIGIDSTGKFMIEDEKVSIKDVPFVRYRFIKFGDEELNYINQMRSIFKHSSHMAEITIGQDTEAILNKIEEELPNVIRFVYIPVVDSNVTDGLDNEMLELIKSIEDCTFDRIMLKDNSNTLHAVASAKLKDDVADILGIEAHEIGICQSPLSFNGNACLTAVKARELSAEYAENDEVALPSANHECMNCCGCIRYHLFDGDVDAPVTKVATKVGRKKSNSTKEKKETTTEKEEKSKGLTFFKF